MKVRYNIFTRFYIEDDSIIVKVLWFDEFIKIWYNKNIYDFFVFLEKIIFISDTDIKKHQINQELIKLFIHYKILIEYTDNSWIESICFDKFIKNPNFLLKWLNKNELNNLYYDVEDWLSSLINKDNLLKYNLPLHEIKFSINEETFKDIWTKRLLEETDDYDLDGMLNIVNYIFLPRYKKEIFGMNRTFYKFWSWGGINSIFPITITKYDDVFVYEKFSWEFFTKKIPWIYENLINDGLITSDTNFHAYNYFVILCSHSKNVFWKYWNKWYKLALLEVWQISFMFRLFCWYFKKPHVELQGFYDDKIYTLLKCNKLFNNEKDILLAHVLAISD